MEKLCFRAGAYIAPRIAFRRVWGGAGGGAGRARISIKRDPFLMIFVSWREEDDFANPLR